MIKPRKELVPLTKKESDEEIVKYIGSKDIIERIIGLLARAKNVTFENNIQIDRFYNRNIDKATELDCYSCEKIIRTMKHLIDNADFKWELSSVIKYIDEDFDKLEGKEPIITLSDGEKIFNVGRIKELEQEGRIAYIGKRWKENPARIH